MACEPFRVNWRKIQKQTHTELFFFLRILKMQLDEIKTCFKRVNLLDMHETCEKPLQDSILVSIDGGYCRQKHA